MRELYIKLSFMLAGLVHLLPVAGLSGAPRLEDLYGISLDGDPVLTLLMQHRALFFGIIGMFLIMAAWQPAHRSAARLVALASMVGFIVLYGVAGVDAPALEKIVWTDVVASLLLIGTFWPMRLARQT